MKFEKFDSMGYLMEFSYLSITDYFNVRAVLCALSRDQSALGSGGRQSETHSVRSYIPCKKHQHQHYTSAHTNMYT